MKRNTKKSNWINHGNVIKLSKGRLVYNHCFSFDTQALLEGELLVIPIEHNRFT